MKNSVIFETDDDYKVSEDDSEEECSFGVPSGSKPSKSLPFVPKAGFEAIDEDDAYRRSDGEEPDENEEYTEEENAVIQEYLQSASATGINAMEDSLQMVKVLQDEAIYAGDNIQQLYAGVLDNHPPLVVAFKQYADSQDCNQLLAMLDAYLESVEGGATFGTNNANHNRNLEEREHDDDEDTEISYTAAKLSSKKLQEDAAMAQLHEKRALEELKQELLEHSDFDLSAHKEFFASIVQQLWEAKDITTEESKYLFKLYTEGDVMIIGE